MNRLLLKARSVREQDLLTRQTSYSSNSGSEPNTQTISPNFEAWTDANAFSQTEPLTIQPSSLTTQGSGTFGSWESEAWYGPATSSDMILSNMPTLCPDPIESGFSTPLQTHAVPTRTNSDLQSLVDGLGSLRPDEVAALFENYPMSY
jgi:hypothetical protein